MDLYMENILDHGQNPRNFGEPLDPADIHYHDDNPFCGDRLFLTAQLDESGHIKAVRWQGEGCTISKASASILGEEIIGKTLDEVKHIDKEQLLDMLGIHLSPTRLKCALLSLKVLKAGAYGLSDETFVMDEDE
ncbi:MAG TPA: iron-sulfur cluster assembly scaffold protein [Aggregatilineaceae bacterium]|nr:iron-sulfur cluster assembly scaffold protein [Aggregatilineaceae bacterium]